MFILTVRNDGLGDLILSLPTLAALARIYPRARLGAVVRPEQAALFELFEPQVEVWEDTPSSRARLRKDRPDVLLFLRPDPRWARAGYLARIGRRIGTRHRWQSLFFNERLPVHRRDSGRHEAECNALLAAPLGVGLPVPPIRLSVPRVWRERAQRWLAQGSHATRGPVVVHPGSAGSSPNWPAGHYAELVELLARAGEDVVVTGGKSEVELMRQVAGQKARVLEPSPLGLLAAIIAEASTVVAGSTGPLHLATALGARVVGLYASGRPHGPERWGPYGGVSVVLQSEPVIRPGGKELAHLKPDRVLCEVLEATAPGRLKP